MKTARIIGTAFLTALLCVTASAYAGQVHPNDKQDKSKHRQNSHEQAKPQQHAQQNRQAHQQAQHKQVRPQQHAQQNRQVQRQAHQSRQVNQSARRQQRTKQPTARQQPSRAKQQAGYTREQLQQRSRSQQAARTNQRNRQAQQQSYRGRTDNARGQHTPERRRVQQADWQQHRSGNWNSDHRSWQQRGGYSGYRIPENRYRGYFGQNHMFLIGGLPFMTIGGYPSFQYHGYWISVVDPWPSNWGNNWYDSDDVYVGYVDNGYYLFNRRYPGVGIAINISR